MDLQPHAPWIWAAADSTLHCELQPVLHIVSCCGCCCATKAYTTHYRGAASSAAYHQQLPHLSRDGGSMEVRTAHAHAWRQSISSIINRQALKPTFCQRVMIVVASEGQGHWTHGTRSCGCMRAYKPLLAAKCVCRLASTPIKASSCQPVRWLPHGRPTLTPYTSNSRLPDG